MNCNLISTLASPTIESICAFKTRVDHEVDAKIKSTRSEAVQGEIKSGEL